MRWIEWALVATAVVVIMAAIVVATVLGGAFPL